VKQKKIIFFLSIVLTQLSLSAQLLKGKMLVGKVPKEQFGRNVKLSSDGNILAVAAPFNSDYGDKNGRIAVYKFSNSNWQMLGDEILAGDDDFEYGEMMALSADGQKLVAASPFGGTSIYSFNGANWILAQTIFPENDNDMINAISITPDAGKIAVAHECTKHRAVCVKLFYFDGKQWGQDGIDLIPYPGERVYRLSLSFSADGNQLVVGNYSKDTRQYKDAGEVIIYAKENNQWKQQTQKFNGELFRASLGSEVILSNNSNTIIASSASIDMLELSTGFVETYQLSGTEWVKQSPTLKPPKHNSYFGHAVSLSGDGTILALSTPYIGFGKPGYVRVYKNKSGTWQEIAMITDADGVEKTSPANNTVGWSIALSSDGKTLAIGFPHNDENGDMAGKVMVYDLSELK
jgi:hypothetical protein